MDEMFHKFWMERSAAEKKDKVERFRRLNPYVKKGQVLFAGSSLMEQFPIYEFLQDFDIPLTIYNRGVGGFTSAELQENIRECILDVQPSHLFINIGTNDLNTPDYSEEALISRYRDILVQVKQALPDVKLYLLAYYPGNPVAAKSYIADVLKVRTNARIASANKAVAALAQEMGGTYLDLNRGLYDEQGNLKEEFTIEGMHMYANGYKAVLDELLPVLLQISQEKGK